MTNQELQRKANELRVDILRMIYKAKTGHIGGDNSIIDMITALYFKHMNISPKQWEEKDPNRDRFVLSKGHAVEALYAALGDRGFFDKEEMIETFSQFGSPYIGHANNHVAGIDLNSGSLGHGLSLAVGMALAGKKDGRDYKVYCVMGDGEVAEGSVWEGAMAAGHYKLNNLIGIVDRNRQQISGTTEEVMTQDSQEERWAAFGWHVISIDGNDMDAVDAALTAAKEVKDRPVAIIANTVKGKGISFMENVASWHHGVPKEEQYEQAMAELQALLAD
ncbi:MAG: transketolase [Lachnospiraceae bacterium]|nr:transketolase [Lachnospiraceae bacterium]